MKGLPEVGSALNNEVTILTGKKPVDAIKEKVVDANGFNHLFKVCWHGREETRLFKKCEISLCRW